MKCLDQLYIDGQWQGSTEQVFLDAINPATEQLCAKVIRASEDDVNQAVQAARKAFAGYSQLTRHNRLDLLASIIDQYQKRYEDVAQAMSEEMGSPITLSLESQADCGLGHLQNAYDVFKEFSFEEQRREGLVIRKEPIGVCGFITPWNWPMNQIACKVGPALAVGCTMVLKPSEIAPLSAQLFAEILHDAGVPHGVFNMVHGDGAVTGHALTRHPEVDMVSFTGSSRAGILVAQNAAPTIKRVTQELGGKSANIILDDADFEHAVAEGAATLFENTGQSCNAPSRMLVPADKIEEASRIAALTAHDMVVGDPKNPTTELGPVANQVQFNKIQQMIAQGIEEGATLVAGGTGKPEGLDQGYYVKPTVFTHVSNKMSVAREEIFGPVLSIIPYEDEEDAIAIANDTEYGLAAYIQGQDPTRLKRIAARLRAGTVNINGDNGDYDTPFGGYKQSGNGREYGPEGFADYLEIKAISGC